MDAIQFGRWVGNQRRKCGWPSQRRLVEEIRQNPFLGEAGISEDFLARLEAGQLAHPFRNTVRQRVLTLAWFLCKNQAELRSYLRSAEIDNLSTDEREQLRRLSEHLKQISLVAQPLPPRPRHVIGRAKLIEDICEALTFMESGVCAITGMVGIGKTTLAYEVLHSLNNDQRQLRQLFFHGSATFSCAGRHGLSGLLSLLDEIYAVYGHVAGRPVEMRAEASLAAMSASYPEEVALARAIQRTQQALAQKSLLLVLDHLEADFPLREAMEALLSMDQPVSKLNATPALRHVLLVTSRYIPAPTLMSTHFHLPPLEHEAALELFETVLGRPISPGELEKSGQICAAVGYLPLAIEVAATAVAAKGIPLALMAEQVAQHPLDMILDSERDLQSKLAHSLLALAPEKRLQFVQLSMIGQRDFDLESAARIYGKSASSTVEQSQRVLRSRADENGRVADATASNPRIASQQLASAAANLGIFVRHSLVELVGKPRNTRTVPSSIEQFSYRLPPLLYAYAREYHESDCVEA